MSFHSMSARSATPKHGITTFLQLAEAMERYLELEGVKEAGWVVQHLHVRDLHRSHLPAK
jgi:hypothetical protein